MNWLEREAKAQSTRRVVVASIVVAITLLVLGTQWRYFSNMFSGPYAIPAVELAKAPNAESLPRYYVKLAADEVIDIGMEEITVRKKRGVERSRSVSAHYYVAKLGDRLLIVKSKDSPGKALQGELRGIPNDVRNGIFSSPGAKAAEPRFYPMMLDTGDFMGSGWIGLGVAALVILGALWYGGLALTRALDPHKHPVLKKLGGSGSLDVLATNIETEINSAAKMKLGNYTFTPRFVVQRAMLLFDVHELDKLIWAYKQVTQNKIYGIIPTGKTFGASINFVKESIEVKGKEATIDSLLEGLLRTAPWAAYGFSDDLKATFDKQRPQLAAWAEERRRNPQPSA